MTTKLCLSCKRKLQIEAFSKSFKSHDGYQHVCKECRSQRRADKSIMGGGNPLLAEFKPRELIEELRYRGYKGTLEYTHKITL